MIVYLMTIAFTLKPDETAKEQGNAQVLQEQDFFNHILWRWIDSSYKKTCTLRKMR